jgi:RNA polymerase sigma-70 factor (ECF subfamily)
LSPDYLRAFEENSGPLFRFAYRLTGSAADAEDIVQECFLALLKPNPSYNPRRTPLRTYLFGAVRNQALKRLRARDKTSDADPDGSHSNQPSPEIEAARSELGDAVVRAVRELPETQREALILAHYEQMSLAEIAEVLAIEVGAVKSRLQRARAALKEMLASYAPREQSRDAEQSHVERKP